MRALPLLASVLALGVPAVAASQTYYQDIRPILVENCVGCHSDEGIAWSMEDAEATYERAARIARAVSAQRMPPWLAEPGHQDYIGDLSLDESTLAVVRDWAAAEYPKGTSAPDPNRSPSHHASFTADLGLDVLPDGGYLPDQSASDEYRCFVVDWTEDEAGFVTGFRAVPGNTTVAHHVVVYAVNPGMVDRFHELDAEEDGAGYRCFGGALPDRLGNRSVRAAYEERYPDGVRELDRSQFWLAHWAPGMDGHVFPEGTGIRMEPGAGLVVQMHYYMSDAPGERDIDTRLDFMVAPEVERPAMHLAQTRGDWLASQRSGTMVIPAGTQRSFEMGDNLGGLLGYISYLTQVPQDQIQALELHSANLHMHAFGHSGEITLRYNTGEIETLLSVPRWDLAWQRDFTFATPKVLDREALDGARLGIRCTFENNTDDTVYGGYGSYDEMCFNFSYIAVQSAPATDSPAEGEGR